jgi:hypothetical protein
MAGRPNHKEVVMRSTLRIAGLLLLLSALLLPLAGYASEGPCPDDPNVPCVSETPPFYVVVNRTFEDLTRTGSGCQPIILNHPDCKDCCGETEACGAANFDLETNVCPLLADRVEWPVNGQEPTVIVYQMCCDCTGDATGEWRYRVRLLHADGTCPIDEQNPGCYEDLPPGTGIDLPTPLIVGGLAVMGVALLATGMVVRRRSVRLA